MTLPFERYNAVVNARAFLLSLTDPKQTPRVPRSVRLQAYQVLKHYPHPLEMDGDLNQLFGKR